MRRSIFKDILNNSIRIMISIILFMTIVVSILICGSIDTKYKMQDNQILNDYVAEVRQTIEEAMEQVNSMLKYSFISNNIAQDRNTIEEKYRFSMNMDAYLGSQENDSYSVNLYLSDQNIYESKYIQSIDNLENTENILRKLKSSLLVWDELIQEDIYGRQIVSFYRKVDSSCRNILECQIVIPETSNDRIIIKNKSEINKGDNHRELLENYSIVLKNKSYAYEYLKSIFLIVCIMALFLAIVIFILRVQNRKITSRISDFIDYIDAVDEKELLEDNLNFNNDNREIEIIQNAISNLIQKIHKLENEKWEYDLALLQKQINPHTLYNSLSAIKFNAFMKHDDDTVNIVDTMVKYYRCVLNRGKTTVTLREELETIKLYVEINERSHGEKYNFTTDIPEELLDIEIVHLLLQPFVENAIIHGLTGKDSECEFKIKARQEGNMIIFVISDNGYGIGTKKLQKLSDIENYDESFGIKNAYRRMKLFYDDSSIKIFSKENQGTTVEIKFKLKKFTEEN